MKLVHSTQDSASPQNVVFILSDEHNRDCLGCYGHPLVRTPNLDALARRGTRFSDAYCNSPICVPSRAALATGRYVHRTGHWDNAHPYQGSPTSWHHAVDSAGYISTSIGKLHFRRAGENGFSEEILPLHVVDGVGDLKGLLRAPLPEKKGADAMARDAGAITSDYFRYDSAICDKAVEWLTKRTDDAPPFALFVSFVMPHFPLQAPKRYFDHYHTLGLETLRGSQLPDRQNHPALKALRRYMNYEDFFTDARRQNALAAYFGMIAAIDELVGRIIAAVDARADADNTLIVYSSDHGENLGNRGLWGKSVLYEDSASIPMIAAGPGVPQSHVCRTPVSLVDIYPTICGAMGLDSPKDLPGSSLVAIANAPDRPARPVFAEYHAAGAETGMFMYREGRFKLIEYVGMSPELFDLETDPDEACNLASDPAYAEILKMLKSGLAKICDTEMVNARAFADQSARIAQHGGRDAVLLGTDIPHTPAPV